MSVNNDPKIPGTSPICQTDENITVKKPKRPNSENAIGTITHTGGAEPEDKGIGEDIPYDQIVRFALGELEIKNPEMLEKYKNVALDLLSILRAFANGGDKTGAVPPGTPTEESQSKSISFDMQIRELMKLLISAFSQLLNSQRQIALNTINNVVTTIQAKIEAMERSKEENYNAAIASAVGTIVMGCFEILGGIAGIAGGAKAMKAGKIELGADKALVKQNLDRINNNTQATSQIFQSIGRITNGALNAVAAMYTASAKDAEIFSAKLDATMEVLRKMQDESSGDFKHLLEFISTLLRIMQELLQNASGTERTIVQA